MTTWNPEELRRIGAADELDIAPARADGTLRRSTTIWVVRVDDDLDVRSYRGPGGAWYRTAQASHEGRIRAGGVERDVFFDEPDDTVRSAVDVAYRTKYARYGDTYVVPMVDDDAAAATFRLTLGDRDIPHSERNRQAMAADKEPSGAEKMFGDFAPALVHFTDDVLFGELWERPQLAPKLRSLVTVAALTTSGNTEQLTFHLQFAKDNGATEEELIEALTHLAFYSGWPKAMSAMAVAKQVFRGN
jgi:4-carboxymuconolactone decarboxylase